MKALVLLVWAIVAGCSADRTPSERQSVRPAAVIPATAFPEIPLTGRVTDAAGVINEAQEAKLSSKLARLERSTGRQFVVVTVPSLGGEDVATFTRDLANAWGIGRAKEDDGVVFLIAPSERQIRIAAGFGLERAIPDAIWKQIIETDVLPHFRKDDLEGGIDAGVRAITARLEQH
ncbi:MAG TPA: TPM domain-containing protein [Sphingomonadaceae bacterium]|nr:TPM domain-containing protein [Sphingomonadaceae bacterium]